MPGANIRCAAVDTILACSLQRLVTLNDYSLPGRFISDCICFSRQRPSIIRFPLTPYLQARRGAEIRIDTSTALSDQITGLALVAVFALVAPVERSPTPLGNAIVAHNCWKLRIVREGPKPTVIVCVSPKGPLDAVVLATLRQPPTSTTKGASATDIFDISWPLSRAPSLAYVGNLWAENRNE